MLRPRFQCRLDFAPQPVLRIAAAFERRWREQDKEMRPCADIFEDDALKVAAGDAFKIEERVIAVLCQVWKTASAQGALVRR
jgi:hypothetical protein